MHTAYDNSHANYSAGSNMTANAFWLLQQPKDSGYASDDNDLFAEAFKTCDNAYTATGFQSLLVPSTQTPALSACSSTLAVEEPFQYADSLCPPSDQWKAYDSALYSNYLMNGGMANMPGFYNNLESLLDSCQSTYASQPQSQPQLQPSLFNVHDQASTTPAISAMQSLQLSSMPDTPVDESPDRGRQRQRMPHTAVEQRYRRNLNLHFGKLRLAVPDIPSSQPQRSGKPPIPSKCEVLTAAVDYIQSLEDEVRRLKAAAATYSEGDDELKRKRARML